MSGIEVKLSRFTFYHGFLHGLGKYNNTIELLSIACVKRQELPPNLSSFLLILKKLHKHREKSPTIHHKYKYFQSNVQTIEVRQQKFPLCCLP